MAGGAPRSVLDSDDWDQFLPSTNLNGLLGEHQDGEPLDYHQYDPSGVDLLSSWNRDRPFGEEVQDGVPSTAQGSHAGSHPHSISCVSSNESLLPGLEGDGCLSSLNHHQSGSLLVQSTSPSFSTAYSKPTARGHPVVVDEERTLEGSIPNCFPEIFPAAVTCKCDATDCPRKTICSYTKDK
eukprot:3935387-Rhodomonas_salina.1